jgi:hypothetical protein
MTSTSNHLFTKGYSFAPWRLEIGLEKLYDGKGKGAQIYI